jgi:hypothetical protein
MVGYSPRDTHTDTIFGQSEGNLANLVASVAYLVSKVFQVVLHKMTAVRSIKDWETPRISEGYEMRFSREEINIEYAESRYLLSSRLGFLNSLVEM